MRAIFWVLGILSLANGLWMMLSPSGWFFGLPAGVPDTGPLNLHLVRDVGAAFCTLGVMFCITAPKAERHRGVVVAAAIFSLLHSLVHVFDLLSGRLGAHHWLLDFPGVFLPTAGLLVLSMRRWWPVQS